MGRGVKRTYRQVTAAFALLGVAFYTLLLPWHSTSQLEQQLFAVEFGTDAEVICQTDADGNPVVPHEPATSCPICKGLAAFQLALIPAPAVIAPPSAMPQPQALAVADDIAGAPSLSPRNRGPPAFPA